MATGGSAKKLIMERNMFRRASSVDREEKSLIIEVSEMSTVLNRMGQKVNEKELLNFINKELDTSHTGHLNYEKFMKVCDKFLTDPAALEKLKGDDFSFKHLIRPEDFNNP